MTPTTSLRTHLARALNRTASHLHRLELRLYQTARHTHPNKPKPPPRGAIHDPHHTLANITTNTPITTNPTINDPIHNEDT